MSAVVGGSSILKSSIVGSAIASKPASARPSSAASSHAYKALSSRANADDRIRREKARLIDEREKAKHAPARPASARADNRAPALKPKLPREFEMHQDASRAREQPGAPREQFGAMSIGASTAEIVNRSTVGGRETAPPRHEPPPRQPGRQPNVCVSASTNPTVHSHRPATAEPPRGAPARPASKPAACLDAPSNISVASSVGTPLGAGVFANVQLKNRAGRPVAVKTYEHAAQAENEFAAGHMANEAKMAGKIQHEHIIAPHAVRNKPGKTELEMEYASGGHLADYVRKNGGIHPDEARRIFAQVALVLLLWRRGAAARASCPCHTARTHPPAPHRAGRRRGRVPARQGHRAPRHQAREHHAR